MKHTRRHLLLGTAATAAIAPVMAAADRSVPYEITVDSREVPDLAEWARSLQPIVDRWYPRLVELLPSDGYTAPRKVRIEVKNEDGVAYASGARIVCCAGWFRKHPEDRGAVVHELAHVVQQYPDAGQPGWLVEGIADYLRWFKYEPPAVRPTPNPATAKYTDSYQTTGAFLNYVARHVEPESVVRLNAALRRGEYRPELWEEYAGATVDALWARYLETLRRA